MSCPFHFSLCMPLANTETIATVFFLYWCLAFVHLKPVIVIQCYTWQQTKRLPLNWEKNWLVRFDPPMCIILVWVPFFWLYGISFITFKLQWSYSYFCTINYSQTREHTTLYIGRAFKSFRPHLLSPRKKYWDSLCLSHLYNKSRLVVYCIRSLLCWSHYRPNSISHVDVWVLGLNMHNSFA